MKKKAQKAPETVHVMTEHELQESRLKLEAEVERQKKLREAGKKPPVRSAEELRAARNAADGIVSLADVAGPLVQKFTEMRERFAAFSAETREKLAQIEPENCIEHPEITLELDEETSIGKTWKNEKLTVVFKDCPLCLAEKKAASETARWVRKGIPQKVLHATFDNYETGEDQAKKKALAKFRAQVKKGSGFILALGKWGTGKSHLGAATLRAAGDGIFITLHDLIGELRQTYTDHSGQDELVDKYRKAKVLVLDEVSPDVKGVDIAPLLYRVLGYRHDKDLLTVLTSNDELSVVKAILGPKLEDRMRENYTIANFTWESHRQPEKL